ncbi:MAG: potassium/proton antiporter [bacterium]|nr:potassium/proton antiporter [Myxococcales bacterium]
MDVLLLTGGLLTLAAIFSTRFARRFGVPALVLFVVIGMLAGSSGPGGIPFADYGLAYGVGLVALATILLSGGLDTDAGLFRASLLPGALLATVGVVVKMLLVAVIAFAITPLDFTTSLLLGAVLAPTDAAAVFSILKGQGLPPRLQGVLETESGTNDPVSIYLTLALAAWATGGQMSGVSLVVGVVVQLALGAAVGWAAGHGLVALVNRVRVDSAGLYPILVLAGGLATYAGANLIGGNGFLAIYLTGLIVGNRQVSHGHNIKQFMDGAAWLAQIAMFLLLGLLSFPDQLAQHLPSGIAITAALIVVARPVSVFLVLGPLARFTRHRFSFAEQLLVSWAGLKGAVPIILAIVPLMQGVPGGQLLFNVVFVVVIIGTTIQGLSIIPLAHGLDLLEPVPPSPPISVELSGAAPPGSGAFDVYLTASAPVVGQALRDVELPPEVVVAAIYRDRELVTPRGDVVFAAEDHVFIISRDAAQGVPAVFLGAS